MLAVGLVRGSYQIYFPQAPSLQVCHNANYICVEGLIPLVFTNDFNLNHILCECVIVAVSTYFWKSINFKIANESSILQEYKSYT